MIIIKNDNDQQMEYCSSFFNIARLKVDENRVFERVIPVKLSNYIYSFYNYHEVMKKNYSMIQKPLRFFELRANISNSFDYELLSGLSITELNLLFDISSQMGCERLEDLCAAFLADYYKKMSIKEMHEKYLVFKPEFSDDELTNIMNNEPDLKSLMNSIEANIESENPNPQADIILPNSSST